MGWTSPTGATSDPSANWFNHANTYDDNEATYATNTWANDGVYLELTLGSAISCNEVRIYAARNDSANPYLYIDVYYGAAWHNIHTGTVTKDTWVEIAVGSTQSIDKARVKYDDAASNYDLYLYEFDFGLSAYSEAASLGLVLGLSASRAGTFTRTVPHLISPTGFTDVDSVWTDEPYAYDRIPTTTWAQSSELGAGWGSTIYFSHAGVACKAIYFKASSLGDGGDVSIRLYYDGQWNSFYQGSFTDAVLTRMATPAKTITWIEFTFYHNAASFRRIYEVYFDDESTKLGLTLGISASRLWGVARSASIGLVLGISASRAIAVTRSAASGLVLGLSASRAIAVIRSASRGLVLGLSASRVWSVIRSSSVGLVLGISASRLWGVIRTASRGLKLGISASRTTAISRAATRGLKLGISATRVFGRHRASALGLVLGITASRLWAVNRASSLGLKLGLTATKTSQRILRLFGLAKSYHELELKETSYHELELSEKDYHELEG